MNLPRNFISGLILEDHEVYRSTDRFLGQVANDGAHRKQRQDELQTSAASANARYDPFETAVEFQRDKLSGLSQERQP
jgi:acyl carrier protein phosphodiesterase